MRPRLGRCGERCQVFKSVVLMKITLSGTPGDFLDPRPHQHHVTYDEYISIQ